MRRAKELLEAMPDLIETAKANLEARSKIAVGEKINVKALIKESPALVAKAEARKGNGGTISAKQAGKVKVRAKGEHAQSAH